METIRHDVNCLQDSRIDTRWKALQRIEGNLDAMTEEEDKSSYMAELIKPLLKVFEDKRDRHRETAAVLVKENLKHLQYESMEWILPVVVSRLANEPAVEQAEPVRLELIGVLNACLQAFPHDIVKRGFLDYFAAVLKVCVKDGDPDMKMACCTCITHLCTACRENTKMVAINIAAAMKPNLRVKQWKVREASIKAFGQLVKHGATEIIYDFRDEPNEMLTTKAFLKALTCDRSESVRQATLDVVADWMMETTDRLDMHRHFVPIVLLAMTDEIEEVRAKARHIMMGLAAFYEMDNEDNRIDIDSRRITLKDIKWYADDTYPDMTMSIKSNLPGTDLRERPPIGARLVVAECCRTFIPSLLQDIIALEWTISNSNVNRRTAAIRILIMTLWFIESNALQYMQGILDALYKVLRDDDAAIKNEAYFCLELMGKLHNPDNYIPLLLTKSDKGSLEIQEQAADDSEVEHREIRRRTLTIFSTTANTTKVNILIAFRYLLMGSSVLSEEQACIITQAVTSNDVVDSEAPEQLMALAQLIEVFQELLLRFGHIKKYEDTASGYEGETPLDFYLFFTLLDIQTCVDVKVTAEAQRVLDKLNACLTGSTTGLYTKHFLRSIADIKNVPLPVLKMLIKHGGPMLTKYTSNIVDIFLSYLHNVRYDVDARGQLAYLTTLNDFILESTQLGVSISAKQLEQIIVVIIVPNGRWHVGGAAHLFRKASLGCLSALLVQNLLPERLWCPDVDVETEEGRKEAGQAKELLTSVVDTWKNALDADDAELRAVVVKMAPFTMRLPMGTNEAADCMKELLLRLDDSNDILRTLAVESLHVVFADHHAGKLTKEVSQAFTPDALKDWTATLLLHMDDPNIELKEAACACLQKVSEINKDIVSSLARDVRSKHMTTRYIDRLLA